MNAVRSRNGRFNANAKVLRLEFRALEKPCKYTPRIILFVHPRVSSLILPAMLKQRLVGDRSDLCEAQKSPRFMEVLIYGPTGYKLASHVYWTSSPFLTNIDSSILLFNKFSVHLITSDHFEKWPLQDDLLEVGPKEVETTLDRLGALVIIRHN